MPKQKTKRGAAKRFRITGSGKIIHRKAWGGHLFKSKTRPRQIRLKGNNVLTPADSSRVQDMLDT